MISFTKFFFVAVAIVFLLNTVSGGPVIDAVNQGTNLGADLAKTGIDTAKTAIDAISKMPGVSMIPGSGQMSDMANMAANLAKGMVNTFKDMAGKATQMLPTQQKQ